ncbi:MAG: hypothetical protein HYZ34_15185, partial [Ignavibacteriae bacterium]|nr:hypothetical protein [Ignavibacteriota bacterium]
INTTGGSRRESYKPAERNVRNEGARRTATVDRGRSNDRTREGRGTDSRVGTSRGRDRGNSNVPKYTPTYRGNNDGGSRRGNNDHGNNTPSYTPPPASSTTPSAPRSTPPPSGNQNTGGNRGSNTRGGGRP